MKLYLLGGEDVTTRDSAEINSKAVVDAGGAPVVLIFEWTAESVHETGKYRETLSHYFKDLGASSVEFAEYTDSLEEIDRKVNRSDLIYLPGGITTILVERIRNKKIDNLLRRYSGVIVGNSAGALALCREFILTKNRDSQEIVTLGGLGLVDLCVKVHYSSIIDHALKKLSERRRIFAIPERSALVYAGGKVSFIGDVYLFQEGRKASDKPRHA